MKKERITGYRLSPQQERVWRQQEAEGGKSYSAQCVVMVEGRLNLRELKEAIRGVVEEHEVLRTRFCRMGAMTIPIQVVEERVEVEIGEYDLRGLGLEEQKERVEELAKENRDKEFDYENGPMVRVVVAELDRERHQVMVSVAAMCADRRGIRNVVKEVSRKYEEKGRGKRAESMQYIDYSEWQNDLMESEETEAGREYWGKQRVKGMEGVRLPLEKEVETGRRFEEGEMIREVGREETEGLERIAEARGVGIEVILEACWKTLIWRLSGEKEQVIGVGFEGRKYEQLKEAVGLYIKYLPVVSRLEGDMRFTELVDQVGASDSEAFDWQQCFTWADLSTANPELRQPLRYGFLFDFETVPDTYSTADLTFVIQKQYLHAEPFKVSLTCGYSADSLRMEYRYNRRLYSRGQMERLGSELEELIRSVNKEPGRRLSELEVMGEREREEIVFGSNETKKGYSREGLIHKLIEEQVKRTPEGVAVVWEGEEITYKELNRRANEVAHYLRGEGVRAEEIVGVCMERSIELMVSVLGILKAGAAYMPLDPEYPRQRLGQMIEETSARKIVTQSWLERVKGGEGCEVVCIDRKGEELRRMSKENVGGEIGGERLAYVIYTSGSTGRPKGVMITHRSICNRLLWMDEEFPLSERDRVLQKTSMSFDASVWELFMPLMSGARLIMAAERGQRDAQYLIETIIEQEVSTLQMVPSMLGVMVEEERFGECRSLKRVYSGGEVLSGELVEKFQSKVEAELINLYGPTEASIDTTYYRCSRDGGEERVPIGKPISNMRVYVVDRKGKVVPKGIAGEMHVGGEGVARGYLKRAEMTAEKFIPDEHSGEVGGRLYRTGDIGRQLEEGNIEYVGRMDQQVKVRGNRIELGEIEAALRRQEGVREAVVVVREGKVGGKRLVGYVVREEKREEEERELRRLENGMEVYEINRSETDILYREIFKEEQYGRHGVRVKEGDVVFDVGANIGMFTLWVADRCKEVKIYAFEPAPPAFEVLEKNVGMYGLEVKAYGCGLSDRRKRVEMIYYPKMTTMSGVYAEAREDEEISRAYIKNQGEEMGEYAGELLERRFEQVKYESEMRSVSEVMREEGIGRIDLLKVDVEKSEMDVLRGIEEEDWEKIKQIVVEVHDKEGRLKEVVEGLKRRGYEVEQEQERDKEKTGLYSVYARRNEEEEEEREEGRGGRLRNQRVSGEELRRKLREELPEYMVPAAVVILEEMPLMANGKIDRGSLPEAEMKEGKYQGPRSVIEEVVAGIWEEVLGVERVGVDDSFFELGGHSLLATQLFSRIRKTFHVEIPLRSLFESPTLASLAEKIEIARRDNISAEAPPIISVARDIELPLSFAQQRLWFLDQLEPGSPFYNIPFAVRLRGELNIQALEKSYNEIVRCHESLRTNFRSIDGKPLQVISRSLHIPLVVIDLQELPEDERELMTNELANAEAQIPFDLSRGPLLRTALLKLAQQEHVLLISMHHIVSDGWSTGIFIHEMVALYQAFSKGRPSRLPDLPIQYVDFAHWQRNWLQGEVLEEQLEYWKRQLAGAPPVLELPTDRPRPAVMSFRGRAHSFEIPKSVAESLRKLSRREGATLFMTLLAAFNALLHRYTNQEEIVIGSPIAGRNHLETEVLIGFFVNTLVLRTDFAGDPTFRDLIGRVREVVLGASGHQDLSFEKLVEELQPERSLSHTPLFQVMFALQNVSRDSLEVSDLAVSPLKSHTGTAKFDLTLIIEDTEAGLLGSLDYNIDLFDAPTISRMADHLKNLLDSIVEDPDQQVSDLTMLTRSERHELLVEWNSTAAEFPGNACFQQLFEAQVMRSPDAVAVILGDERLTYLDLNQRANVLASTLIEHGVGAESVVALLAERSIDFLAAIIGVFKAGGAYLPLDPRHPAKRLQQVIEQSRTRWIVSSREFLPVLSQALETARPEANRFIIQLEETLSHADVGENPPAVNGPRNLAYVIYTSGSTGVPKGAMIEQRGMINHLFAKVQDLNLTEADTVAQTASQCFDISVWQFLTALLVGGSVHIIKEETAYDPAALMNEAAENVTILETVPSMMRAILETTESSKTGVERSSKLRWVLATGEALAPELCRQWKAKFGEIQLLNAYGPTECSDDVTHYEVRGAPAESDVIVPIGRPVINTQIYILDRRLRPVPVGIAGEIYVGGAGVGRGYLNEPARTAESFTPDPFGREVGGRLYKTGDLADYTIDGRIEYLGRIDHQVKVRGHRIELGEVESVLEQNPAVREAVVTVIGNAQGDSRLVAYVVKDRAYQHADEPEGEWGSQHVQNWEEVFDEIYGKNEASSQDGAINRRVWTNSYTGAPLTEEEIFECVEDTTTRILSLAPDRVLEIGCGTGLILNRIRAHCSYYCGTDVSAEALSAVKQRLTKEPGLAEVTLLQRAADELEGIPEESFDLVILNEIVQYFPNIDYLMRAVRGALKVVKPGGHIFLGGIRNFRLIAAFHASVELAHASPALTISQLKKRVQKQIAHEKELLVDHHFFYALKQLLPQISDVQVQLKGGHHMNELTKFRYDVVLHVNGEKCSTARFDSPNWNRHGLTLDQIRRTLTDSMPDVLSITGVPNARIMKDVACAEFIENDTPGTAGDLAQSLRKEAYDHDNPEAIHPEQVWAMSSESSYRVNICWSDSGPRGSFDLLFTRNTAANGGAPKYARISSREVTARPWSEYANNPVEGMFAEKVVPSLRNFLRQRIPDYMVPSAFVFLDQIPLTPNGKVDRRALPAPEETRAEQEVAYEAPRNMIEEMVAGIWAEVIDIERVGIHDNFFELGGHSLLATQVVSRIRAYLHVELPLRVLFEGMTVAQMAEAIIAKEVEPGQTEKLAMILSRMMAMSDEEVQKALEVKRKKRGEGDAKRLVGQA